MQIRPLAVETYGAQFAYDTLQEEFQAWQEGVSVREPAASQDISNLLSPEVCSSERNYFEPIIGQFSEMVRSRRDEYEPQDIPQACILYSMRRQHRLAEKESSPSYARCASENAEPQRGAFKPCVSQGYFFTVYNAFVDVMNCFGLEQKYYFPQITYESAFHINAIAMNDFDGGIAQYTKRGVLRVLQGDFYNRMLNELQVSSRPSCKRVAAQLGPVAHEMAEVEKRCSFLTMPKNPWKSLVFFAIHHLRDESILRMELEKRGLFDRLMEAGWDRFNKEDFVRMLSLLSYNAGVEGTLNHLKTYLDGRIKMRESVKAEHFDFSKDMGFIREKLRQDADRGKERRRQLKRNKLKSAQIKKLTFPEYLWIWHAPYMSEVTYIQRHFDRALGEQFCTDRNYLRFRN